MKKMLLSGLAVALFAGSPAFAADMPVKAVPMVSPVTTWGGFYFGASAGGAWDKPDPENSLTFGTSSHAPGDTSWIFGLHTAYNWQFGHLVVGTQSSYLVTDLKSSAPCPAAGFTCQQRTQNILLTGGRAGFALNEWMLYGTGGYARTQLEAPTFGPTGAFSDAVQHWHNGWYAGAGLEWAWTPKIHFGVEYDHINVNTRTDTALPIGAPPDMRTTGDKIDMVQARVSFKFWEGAWGPFSQ